MALEFSSGDDFSSKLFVYMLPYFRKGIPSLFAELRHLYKDAGKVKVIERLLLSNLESLEKSGTFAGSMMLENPCCLLWNYILLAQHFDKIGNLDAALEYINKSITHTPTLIELYLTKAKILKHKFAHNDAYQLTEKVCSSRKIASVSLPLTLVFLQARMMDLADRYLNNKSIKYALRCGQVEQAYNLLRLFLKDPSEGNPFELQTLWFETAQSEILLKRGDYTQAMRMLKFVQKAFFEIHEDQFDFHTYCIRRFNLNTYQRLISYESNVHS